MIQIHGDLSIGRRSAHGTVDFRRGTIAVSGTPNSSVYVGQGIGMSPGEGGVARIQPIGDAGRLIATGSFIMNANDVNESILLAEIGAPSLAAFVDGGYVAARQAAIVPESSTSMILVALVVFAVTRYRGLR